MLIRVVHLAFPDILDVAIVWLVDLSQPVCEVTLDLLSSQEQAIANRFVQDLHRQRYINAHCALRNILSISIGQPARTLEFANGRHGKPFLVNHQDCVFNLSHSGNWAVIAIGKAPRLKSIGVDIEVMRNISNLNDVAHEVLTAEEETELRLVSEDQKVAAFLHGWVRKESVLKALGTGLSLPAKLVHAGLAAKPVKVTARIQNSKHFIDLYSMHHPYGFSVAVALI